jgi:GNAT superfamily N-acetyltransferase
LIDQKTLRRGFQRLPVAALNHEGMIGMALQIIKDYKTIPINRISFNTLAGKIFGIDFEKWYQLGFWNDRYVCYSFADSDRVVANVSASRLDIIWEGRRISAVQIGTAMTDPQYRNRGLAAKLMDVVLKEYEKECELFYLFANKKVLNFYPKFGFHPVKESRFSAEINTKNRYPGEFRKLDISNVDDVKLLAKMVRDRIPVSRIIDVDHAESIVLWHCLNNFPQDIYYFKKLNVLAIANTADDTLHLYDVVCSKKPAFLEIFKRLAPQGVDKIIFYFTPDFGGIDVECRPYEQPDDTLFIKPVRINLSGDFCYPFTAHT